MSCPSLGMEAAESAEGPGLPTRISGRPEQIQGALDVFESIRLAALLLQHPADVDVGTGLSEEVPDPIEQLQGVLQVIVGLAEAAQRGVCAGPEAQGLGQGARIGEPSGCDHADSADAGLVVPEPPHIQVVEEVPGQLPAVGVESGVSGRCDGGHENRLLGVEPGQRPAAVDRRVESDASCGGLRTTGCEVESTSRTAMCAVCR